MIIYEQFTLIIFYFLIVFYFFLSLFIHTNENYLKRNIHRYILYIIMYIYI